MDAAGNLNGLRILRNMRRFFFVKKNEPKEWDKKMNRYM